MSKTGVILKNIKIEPPFLWPWEVDTYVAKVEGILEQQILATESGVILLEAMAATGRTVTVHPLRDDDQYNAFAKPTDSIDSIPAGEPMRYCNPAKKNFGQPVRGRMQWVDDAFGTDVFDDHRAIGTGSGSDSIIEFTPSTFDAAPKMPACGKSGTTGWRADEVLFHELCHSYRHTKGRRSCEPVEGGYTQFEEFFAIVLSNIYLSESDGPSAKLRRNHQGFCVIDDSKPFPSTETDTRLLAQLIKEEQSMCKRFKEEVKATFNPF